MRLKGQFAWPAASPTGDGATNRPRAGTGGARLLAIQICGDCVSSSRGENHLRLGLPSSACRRRGSPCAGPDEDGPEKARLTAAFVGPSPRVADVVTAGIGMSLHRWRNQGPPPSSLFSVPIENSTELASPGAVDSRSDATPIVAATGTRKSSHLLHVILPSFDLRLDDPDHYGEQFRHRRHVDFGMLRRGLVQQRIFTAHHFPHQLQRQRRAGLSLPIGRESRSHRPDGREFLLNGPDLKRESVEQNLSSTFHR